MATISRDKLEGNNRASQLADIPLWHDLGSVEGGRDAIQRKFQFTDFKQAWAFMSLVAVKAEEMDHHPEWFNVYNRVDVTLATHTCSGVSLMDIELAKALDSYALQIKKKKKIPCC
eukprot:TRINITY_DN12850_c0_g1_i1.p2 TRINITY_DN12850_c0_g1~~TRINITY_DN12850_c0_g1_i1.p2  ORF type:complete len:116 (-),score=21.28 TRINITY_DN12850_c0_g1_i1:51-398(-)